MERQYIYRNTSIRIIERYHEGKPVYALSVNRREITFVSCPQRALILAVNYVDTIRGEALDPPPVREKAVEETE